MTKVRDLPETVEALDSWWQDDLMIVAGTTYSRDHPLVAKHPEKFCSPALPDGEKRALHVELMEAERARRPAIANDRAPSHPPGS
jgi:hypothetical protein